MELPGEGEQVACRLVGRSESVQVTVERAGGRLRFSYARHGRVHLVRDFDPADPMLHQEMAALTPADP